MLAKISKGISTLKKDSMECTWIKIKRRIEGGEEKVEEVTFIISQTDTKSTVISINLIVRVMNNL